MMTRMDKVNLILVNSDSMPMLLEMDRWKDGGRMGCK